MKNKLLVLLGGLAVMVVIAVVLYSFIGSKVSGRLGQMNATAQLPAAVLDVITDNAFLDALFREPQVEQAAKPGFQRYLCLEYFNFSLPSGQACHAFSDESLNRLLGADANLGRGDIDGLVVVVPGAETVGRYDNGAYAYRAIRVLNYLRMPDAVVIRRDTIWGGQPPATTNNPGGETGSEPDAETLAEAIRGMVN